MVRRYLASLLLLATPAFAAVELDADSNGATDVSKGGTNATTAAGARTALGVPATAATLVGDCTVGPCFDGSADGGNYLKFWAGTGSYWTALQGGAPDANRSWRLPIAAAPAAGETLVMTMDEYGQMGFLAAPEMSGYVLGSTDAGVLSWVAGGSAGDNLGSAAYSDVVALWTTCTGYLKSDGTCDTPSGSATYPSVAGVANWGGSAWGTSYTVGTGASNLVQLNASAQLPAVSADLLTITDTGTYFTTDTVAAALQELGSELADVTEITLDANTLTITDGVLSVIGGGTGTSGYLSTPPTYSDEACTPGQYALSESYRWDCVATGNWNRTALTDWSNPAPVPPTLTSATVGSLGLYADLLFSEPVEAGTGGSGGWSMNCATTGAISMTYSSGDTTNTLAYSLSTPPIQDETCTVSYAQPTDGIEAVDDGTDLATIPSAAVTNNSTQTPASACMSGTYTIAWDGSHTSGATYACDSLGNAVAGTVTGSPDISSTYGEGSGDIALMADATNKYLSFTDSGGAIVDINGAQTVWMRMYISAIPTGDTKAFTAIGGTDQVNVVVKSTGNTIATYKIGASSQTAYGAGTLTPGTWVDVGYTWDFANKDHAVDNNGTWDEDLDELSATEGTDVTSISSGTLSAFNMAAGEHIRITKMAVVAGYKAAKPW